MRSTARAKREVELATSAGTPIIALLLEPVDVPNVLTDEIVIDLTAMQQAQGPDLLRIYRDGLDRLVQVLDQTRPIILFLRELNDDDVSIRQTAARKLGELDDPSATDALIQALNDPDEDVRYLAAEALGIKQAETAVQPLLRVLEDDQEDPDVGAAAAIALGQIGHHGGVVEILVRRLTHPDRFVREAAAQALGDLAPLDAVQPLVHMMRNDPISNVREAATTALCVIRARTESDEAARALRRARVDWRTRVEGVGN